MPEPSVSANSLPPPPVPPHSEGEGTQTPDADAGHRKGVLLLGNPNVGKTTLFNLVCRRRSHVANYPGTSVSIGRGTFSEHGTDFHLIDTPGMDSTTPDSEDNEVSRGILLGQRPDIIAMIGDGKNLRKSLRLTLELAEYRIPLLLNINMMDEAAQRGVSIDADRLSTLLGVPVTMTVATEGRGVGSFRRSLIKAAPVREVVTYPAEVESAIAIVTKLLKASRLPPRAVAVALLTGDEGVKGQVIAECGQDIAEQVEQVARAVQSTFSRPLSAVMAEARLRAVDQLLSEVQSVSPPASMPFSEKVGKWSRQLPTGIPIAALVVVLMYCFVGKFGAQVLVGLLEGKLFGELIVPNAQKLLVWLPLPQLVREALVGESFGLISVGLTLALGIVLPVLATFFFAFAILEDSGYLPRLAVLLDRGFRKIGLNGKGILPLVMGFSCITMAILTTRMLDTKRERYIATLLLTLGLPCAPLLSIMLVLLAKMSIWASVTVFGVIGLQIIVIGYIADKVLPGRAADFILELPPIRIPKLAGLLRKTSWRTWWFCKEAIPLFLLATFVLFLLDQIGTLALIERAAEPILTGVVGLPQESARVAIATLVRREAGAALLAELSGKGLFDNVQIVVCLLVLTFFSPCVNAVLVMLKERGLRGTLSIVGFVTPYALLMGAIVNWVCRALGVTFN